MTTVSAPVFDIQRFSIHDGPGIRSVVFFKGCSLACAWCHNPEAVRPRPELAYYSERCIEDCDECVGVCPQGALGTRRVARADFSRCTVCDRCADACPAEALVLIGRDMTPDELLEAVLRDRPFYERSGGGVTLSGGEPVLQADFLRHFLPLARSAGLHLALETAGSYPSDRLVPLLPHLDLILFDLKLADPERHARWTGRDNRLVLATLRELLALGAPVRARLPVVPGINTGAEEIAGMATLLDEFGLRDLELLPYNHLWEAKLPRLATERVALGITPPAPDLYTRLRQQFAAAGIDAHLGPRAAPSEEEFAPRTPRSCA